MRPARLGRHPEDSDRAVLVRVFGVGAFTTLGLKRRMLLLERIGDVLEEDESEHNMFVLGRVHVVAERVRHLPQVLLEPERRAIGALLCRHPYSYLARRAADFIIRSRIVLRLVREWH